MLENPGLDVTQVEEHYHAPLVGNYENILDNSVCAENCTDFKDLQKHLKIRSRREVAALFDSILELDKEGKIDASQEDCYGPILVKKA